MYRCLAAGGRLFCKLSWELDWGCGGMVLLVVDLVDLSWFNWMGFGLRCDRWPSKEQQQQQQQ